MALVTNYIVNTSPLNPSTLGYCYYDGTRMLIDENVTPNLFCEFKSNVPSGTFFREFIFDYATFFFSLFLGVV